MSQNNIFIIDTGKPEAIQMLADLLSKHIKQLDPVQPSTKPDWVNEKVAREILAGGGKLLSRETLKKLRDSKKIEFKATSPRKRLYSIKSINKFIES